MSAVSVVVDPGIFALDAGDLPGSDSFRDRIYEMLDWATAVIGALKHGPRDVDSSWFATDEYFSPGLGSCGTETLTQTLITLSTAKRTGSDGIICSDAYNVLYQFLCMFSPFGGEVEEPDYTEDFLADEYSDDPECLGECRVGLECDVADRGAGDVIVASAQKNWQVPIDRVKYSIDNGRLRCSVSDLGTDDDGAPDTHLLARRMIATIGFNGNGDEPFIGLRSFSKAAFPHLRFCDDMWATTDLNSLDGVPSKVAETVFRHLSVLDDNFSDLFGQPNPLLQTRLRALGVNESNENDLTRKEMRNGNVTYAGKRTRTYRGASVMFDLHDKVTDDGSSHDRLYFDNGFVDDDGQKHILIGFLSGHLEIKSTRKYRR